MDGAGWVKLVSVPESLPPGLYDTAVLVQPHRLLLGKCTRLSMFQSRRYLFASVVNVKEAAQISRLETARERHRDTLCKRPALCQRPVDGKAHAHELSAA